MFVPSNLNFHLKLLHLYSPNLPSGLFSAGSISNTMRSKGFWLRQVCPVHNSTSSPKWWVYEILILVYYILFILHSLLLIFFIGRISTNFINFCGKFNSLIMLINLFRWILYAILILYAFLKSIKRTRIFFLSNFHVFWNICRRINICFVIDLPDL